MRFNTLQDWLTWLESCHPSEIDLGLERVGAVANRLGLDFSAQKTQVITVAGTNGKGSCVATLNAILRAAGYQVGCFTSPHFIHYNERIVVNDQAVSDQCIVESFARIDVARGDTSLTYFEFGTLAALDIFLRSELDVVVLEVGLGGRLDAVNIIDADIAIVTSIDIDHENWLGSDRNIIGAEKAGIFRDAKPALCGDPDPTASIEKTAKRIGADLFQRGKRFDVTAQSKGRWNWQGEKANGEALFMRDLPRPNLPLTSVAVAIQALQLLPLSIADDAYQCLQTLTLPGRFQTISRSPDVILDVAHNPAAASLLAEQLKSKPISGRTYALFAMMADKDITAVLSALKNSFDGWFVAGLPEVSRALPVAELIDYLTQQGLDIIQSANSVAESYQQAQAVLMPDDRLVVFGSFFTVSEIMQCHGC